MVDGIVAFILVTTDSWNRYLFQGINFIPGTPSTYEHLSHGPTCVQSSRADVPVSV